MDFERSVANFLKKKGIVGLKFNVCFMIRFIENEPAEGDAGVHGARATGVAALGRAQGDDRRQHAFHRRMTPATQNWCRRWGCMSVEGGVYH